MLHKKSAAGTHIETPKSILLILEDLVFATKGRKKFLTLRGEDVFFRQLGNGCIHALFRETVRNAFEGGISGSRFPVLALARKGKILTEEEVAALKFELEAVGKLLESTPPGEIWTLSFDTTTGETNSKKIGIDELTTVCSQHLHPLTPSDLKNCSNFISSILQAYSEVCDKSTENKTGAYWAEAKKDPCQELP